jgi:magnesium transporter
MTQATLPAATPVELRFRFLKRRKLMTVRADVMKLADDIKRMLAAGEIEGLREYLHAQYPADLADALFYTDEAQDRAVFDLLDDAEAAEVLDEVDAASLEHLARTADPERLARILAELPADEAADIAGVLTGEQRERVLAVAKPKVAAGIRRLLAYTKDSAGGLMTLAYVAVPDSATQADGVRAFVEQGDDESLSYIFVVDAKGALKGMVQLRQLLAARPDALIRDLMLTDPPAVTPNIERKQITSIFAHYDLNMLPVVEPETRALIGVITADDVIDALAAEEADAALHMAGSDAEELERRSPARIAVLRLPWIMATMFIELLAGLVIHYFDSTLGRVLLLASFMPIISAISGNTGLQSATIIVRGLSAGQVQVSRWQYAVVRQLKTTVILSSATGLTLGIIGALWYGKWTFGLVIFIGMFCAVNIAGIVGTVVPLISKSLGFDPALTSGPFETAFQDVVGISIFLGLATALINYLL